MVPTQGNKIIENKIDNLPGNFCQFNTGKNNDSTIQSVIIYNISNFTYCEMVNYNVNQITSFLINIKRIITLLYK